MSAVFSINHNSQSIRTILIDLRYSAFFSIDSDKIWNKIILKTENLCYMFFLSYENIYDLSKKENDSNLNISVSSRWNFL